MKSSNCSAAFDELVENSWYCNFNNLVQGLLMQDPPASKVLASNVSLGGMWVTWDFFGGGGAYLLSDSWADYRGWRVPVVVPEELQSGVGKMTGHALDNGFVDFFNNTAAQYAKSAHHRAGATAWQPRLSVPP